jgi:hypothetical protein
MMEFVMIATMKTGVITRWQARAMAPELVKKFEEIGFYRDSTFFDKAKPHMLALLAEDMRQPAFIARYPTSTVFVLDGTPRYSIVEILAVISRESDIIQVTDGGTYPWRANSTNMLLLPEQKARPVLRLVT